MCVCLLLAGCGGGSGGGGNTTPPPPSTYTLTVNSVSPATGVSFTVSPADNNGKTTVSSGLSLTYNAGTSVTVTAPATSTGNTPAVTSVSVTPSTPVTIGSSQQFTANVAGTGTFSNTVTWSIAAPSGSSLSPGTLSSSGLFQTPYPAPATVTVTATSTASPAFASWGGCGSATTVTCTVTMNASATVTATYGAVAGNATITLNPPATATGPVLSVDAGNQTRAISPLIYGMNAYVLDTTTANTANITVARWGGDDTSRYNYQTNISNSASDYYFLNGTGAGGLWPTGKFTDLVTTAAENGIKVLGTVPVQGWVANSSTTACSFPAATNPGQVSYVNGCGDGELPNSSDPSNPISVFGNNTVAALTSIAEPPPTPPAASAVNTAWAQATWTGGWVQSLVTAYGQGNPGSGMGKGVAFYDLDNEPAWWDAVHRDVHPVASTYDEVTNGGIGTALAIKTIDPTANVDGPVVDYWENYFYSKKDIESGWGSGPCFEPWDNPTDRQAHGGVPFIEYYLQQFAAAEKTYGVRLLDYVDLHTYDAASYQGNSVAFAPAGDTGVQQARLNSTRAFWDPTYTDPGLAQPNYVTDANYTTSCNMPLQSPQLIPMMQGWAARDYPGTKTAIDEYNWGAMESINGAVAQADILGIFGAYGLDLATLWPTTNYSTQVPGTMAFAMYRNYDGNKSTFGDMALASGSSNQGQLAVYGGLRTADGMVTVMVINKTYGSLTSTVQLANMTPNGNAQVYQYSNANLAAIVAQPALTVSPKSGMNGGATVTATFPAQSITLLVVPQK